MNFHKDNMKVTNVLFLALCVVCYSVADTRFNGFEFPEQIGSDLTSSRIIGGEDAEEGQFPYQVSLRFKLNGKHFCGGSILTNRFLLTAAHCTQENDAKPKFVYAVLGALRRLSGGVIMKLDKITPHQKYNPIEPQYDVSLIRTAKEIVFTDTIQPIALPTQNTPGDIEVLVSGWGRTSYPFGNLADILQFTRPNTLTVEECKKRFKGTPYQVDINKSILCTINGKDVGACHGDSGGPLVDASNPENKTLVGVVSWGIPCAKGYPDAFARVHYFLDWIHDEMKKQSADFK